MFTRHEATSKPINVAERFAALEADRKKALRESYLNRHWAVFAVAFSVLIVCFSFVLKVIPVLVFLALWLPLLLKDIRLLTKYPFLLLNFSLPLLCILSTIWSNYPSKTLYYSTAFLASMLCVTLMARTVAFNSLIKGLVLGTSLGLIITLLNGRYVTPYMSYTPALTGLFGSKNVVGFVAEIGILAAITLGYMQERWLKKCMYAGLPLILCCACLYLSRSGTALVSLIFAIFVILTAIGIRHLPIILRYVLLGLCPLLLTALILFVTQISWEDWALKNLGKDATLTGRTYLWEEGLKIAKEHPILGQGYSAFWIQGNPQAERYWKEFYIADRMGFHFHSTFVQAAVDMGLIGAVLITLQILVNCWLSVRKTVRTGISAESLLLLGFSFMFLLRACVEVDFFAGPFGLGVFIFYLILPRLLTPKHYNPNAPAVVSLSSARMHA